MDYTNYDAIELANEMLRKEIQQLQAENEILKAEKPIPYAYWKETPDLAQKVMERIFVKNEHLQAENVKLKGLLILARSHLGACWCTTWFMKKGSCPICQIDEALKETKP